MTRSQVFSGDALETLRTMEAERFQCCVTSPPYYGLRDYKMSGQLGLEKTPTEYVEKMVAVFREVRRALKDDGTLWLNIGDSYASTWSCGRRNAVGNEACDYGSRQIRTGGGVKEKDLIGIPWMLAFALRADGWYLRQEIIWAKPNSMPESVRDRCTKSHEQIFLLTKSPRYYYDAEAMRQPLAESTANDNRLTDPDYEIGRPDRGFVGVASRGGGLLKPRLRGSVRPHEGFNGKWDGMSKNEQQANGANRRSVWTVATVPYREAHFATMPPKLVEPCIKAGSKIGDTILDPFSGAGTVGLVAARLGRHYVGIELNPEYVEMSRRRIHADAPLFHQGVE